MVEKLLGTTKLTTYNKMTLIEEAAKELGAKKGDLIGFYIDDGKVVIKKC